MVIFNSYVKLPEGRRSGNPVESPVPPNIPPVESPELNPAAEPAVSTVRHAKLDTERGWIPQ